MQQFYTDPETIDKLLSLKQKPQPKAGDKFQNLTFTGVFGWTIGKYNGNPNHKYLCCECTCDCGSGAQFYQIRWLGKEHRCCGCTRRAKFPKHDKRIQRIWRGMLERCLNPKHDNFHNYGGNGVTVCEEWIVDFWNFHEWAVGAGYREDLTLDRKSNKEGYSPANCRWATVIQQHRNTKTNRMGTAWGETKCIKEWAEDSRCLVTYENLLVRVARYKMPLEIALTTPSNRGHRIKF